MSLPVEEDPWNAPLLPVADLLPTLMRPRRVAKLLSLATLLFLLFAALAPWQQNVSADGSVLAYTPNDRPQPIEATISGRVAQWHVVEGQRVEEGELLVELTDNDPERLRRLAVERDAAQTRHESYQQQVIAYRDRIEALRRVQTAEIEAAQAEVEAGEASVRAQREMVAAAKAKARVTTQQQERIKGLAKDGLSSTRDNELANLGQVDAAAKLSAQRAKLRGLRASLETKRAKLNTVRAKTGADLNSADGTLRSSETLEAGALAKLAALDSKLAQQTAQRIHAPRAGVVQRVLVQQGGMQVSRGQTLAMLVPDTEQRAVALRADGNDAALISPGRAVRLQFEGWPAVQFSGWPSVAVGTFGGRVAFVDPADDGQGDFRVVVLPDDDDEPWPDAQFLRQGARARGWILLDEVSVGFEIWRQLNGFPPRFDSAPKSANKAKPKGGEKKK